MRDRVPLGGDRANERRDGRRRSGIAREVDAEQTLIALGPHDAGLAGGAFLPREAVGRAGGEKILNFR